MGLCSLVVSAAEAEAETEDVDGVGVMLALEVCLDFPLPVESGRNSTRPWMPRACAAAQTSVNFSPGMLTWNRNELQLIVNSRLRNIYIFTG